jgi:hypothetical protein
MLKEEIQRMRTLETGGQWVDKRTRLPGQLYENDDTTKMKNIAETTHAKFERHGITTVLDMKMTNITYISAIMGDKEFRVSEMKLNKWKDTAEQANGGSVPPHVSKDHMQGVNHYLSQYGLDWKDEIQKCNLMAVSIYITQMMHPMADEVYRVTKGTGYKGN